MDRLPKKVLLIALIINAYPVNAQDISQQTEQAKTGLFNSFKAVAKGIKDGVVEALIGGSEQPATDDAIKGNGAPKESTANHAPDSLANGLGQAEQFIASLTVSKDGQLTLNGLAPGMTLSDVERHLATRLKVEPSTHASLNSNGESLVSTENLNLKLGFYSEGNHTVLTEISAANPLNLKDSDLNKLKATLKQKGLKEYELEDDAYEANSLRLQLLYLRPNAIVLGMGVDEL